MLEGLKRCNPYHWGWTCVFSTLRTIRNCEYNDWLFTEKMAKDK